MTIPGIDPGLVLDPGRVPRYVWQFRSPWVRKKERKKCMFTQRREGPETRLPTGQNNPVKRKTFISYLEPGTSPPRREASQILGLGNDWSMPRELVLEKQLEP
jgi:hypothetical protein